MSYWILEFIRGRDRIHFSDVSLAIRRFPKTLIRKSLTYRFAFCLTVSVLLINTLRPSLGLFHINTMHCIFPFYGILSHPSSKKKGFACVYPGSSENFLPESWAGNLSLQLWPMTVNIFSVYFFFLQIESENKRSRLEYGILSVLILFAIAYFSYGAFQNHSYMLGDMYVHHAWIYGLKEGNIFSAGVYPEAMNRSFIYSMDVPWNLHIQLSSLPRGNSCGGSPGGRLLPVPEILKSRYTVYLILAAFLTIDVVCIDEIYGMARLQYTIPQEFGLYTLFLCTLYLIRFLKRENKGFDGNLFLFMTSLSLSLWPLLLPSTFMSQLWPFSSVLLLPFSA